MATFTKLPDNEMNYYQFKAKQILLQKKEEKDWQDFCKQIAPHCVACLAEKSDIKESKDIGMQTLRKTPNFRTDKTPIQLKCDSKQIPEALVNIKTRLEKIDLVLSNLFDESYKNEKERNCVTLKPTFPSQETVKTFEEQKKLQIQNSLRASLQNPTSVFQKKSPNIKPRNSSFFLPHDLEVKRTAARRAYLASLQTKPKVAFQNMKHSSIEKVKNSQSKKSVSTRKKILPRKENQKSKKDEEETLVKAIVAEDSKDENIEGVVDAIFEDLLGETALDLNRIRQKKREKYGNTENEISDKVKKSCNLYNPPISSSIKYNDSKYHENDNSIMKLKLFIDSFRTGQEENNFRNEQIEIVDKSTTAPNIEDSKPVHAKNFQVVASNFQKKQEDSKTASKFLCGVTRIIDIDPEKTKDIASKRDRFWNYLKNISRIPKGDFNPWILNEMLAESILDDTISDIAKELSEMPSNIVKDIYNQEFVQQIEN